MAKTSNNSKGPEYTELLSRLDRITQWVHSCDTKASILFTIESVFVGILLSSDYVLKTITSVLNVTFVNDGDKHFSLSAFILLLGLFGIVVLLPISLFYLVSAIAAKTSTNIFKDKTIKIDSLLFFDSIAQYKQCEDLEEAIQKEGEKERVKDVLSQIYINSKRCKEKFTYYQKGMRYAKWLLLFIGLLFVGVIMYNVVYLNF